MSSSQHKQQFYVGPQKINPKEDNPAPPPTTTKTPVKRRPRTDPVAEAHQLFLRNVQAHRERFQQFLRTSLGLLDDDIVTTVVSEFESHCAAETRIVESTCRVLSTATRNRLLPELRHFQLMLDAAEQRCT